MTIGKRVEYDKSTLTETDLDPSPFAQFAGWFDVAMRDDRIAEANAMTIATVGADGAPSARVVLLRGHGEAGLVFYTNYLSRKGRELERNSHIACVFFWPDLQRQVRIEGTTSMLSAAESDEYFSGRPIKSQIGATVSQQSSVIASRDVLDNEMRSLEALDHIDRPEHWGGYRIAPAMFEFWQGRRSRLHDRLRYRLVDGQWHTERLAP